jgi:hypothetical protein
VSSGDYEINFDGTNWSATRSSDDSVVPIAGFPATIDGIQISLTSGAAAAGDRFLVRAASEFANDFSMVLPSPSRLATGLAAAPLAAATTGDAGCRLPGDQQRCQPHRCGQHPVHESDHFNVTAPVPEPTGGAYTPGMT